MAFDAENIKYVLIEFALDSETWRIADEEVVLSDGTHYEGAVEGITALREDSGRLIDPRVVSPSVRIRIRNTGDAARQKIDSLTFPNREVTIKAASSESASDTLTRFVGTVRFPSGISWDDEFVTIAVTSRIDVDERVLPPNKIFPGTYPNAEAKSLFLPIPIVWGDFRTTAGGGEKVPCYCIDTTAGTGGKFKIADHALKDIEVVYLNGADITANCTLDEANGEFTISSTSTYDPDTDTVTANVLGATDDGTTGGTALETLPDHLDDMLTTWLGAAAAKIDTAAFTAWGGTVSADDSGRRWLGTEVLSTSLITEILVAGFADLIIEDGKYKPVYRIVDPSAGIPTYYEWDIVDRTARSKHFSVTQDPERVYANQIVATYRFDPAAGDYAQRYDVESASAIAAVGTRIRRRIPLAWHYKTNGAESRANRELHVFSQELEVADVAVKAVAIDQKPTDQFYLSYSKYDLGTIGTPFRIKVSEADFSSPNVLLTIWNMTNLSPGRWTVATATTWLLSTTAERNSQGYWTDGSGYADPSASPDPASQKSIWF